MTVKSLFSRAHRWTQRVSQRGSGSAKQYCLVGAIDRVYGNDGESYSRYTAAVRRVTAAIKVLFPNRTQYSIAAFNDDPNTTLADVRRVVKRARV